ncbi:MAG: M48 family metallopeptidase [Rhodocyclaceae bacterium]
MDFFGAQDHARRNSRLLVLWFLAAVVGVICSVYLALVLALGFTNGNDPYAATATQVKWWDPGLFMLTLLGVGGMIGLGSVYKMLTLSRGGGAVIAAELGGRLVSRDTTDELERRLINVVDEMAIASGIPSPPVYVLDDEQGINAFAAGAKTTDGVVAVTRGTLQQLSRDELQGVIAHEFSHILNGDMRLNLRLIGVLHGILLLTLAGRVMMRSARGSDKGAAPMVLMGLAFVVIGYIGVLFGKLIKAAVSREREYLADAAAVQFTRNPAGIAGALKRIAGIGSEIHHPRAEEASHMFFGSGAHFSRLLATHPPIEMRIKRVDPSFDARALRRAPGVAPPAMDAMVEGATPSAFVSAIGNPQPAHVEHTHALIASIPAAVLDTLHSRDGARAAICALLLSRSDSIRDQQLAEIATVFGQATADQTLELARWHWERGPEQRLPTIDLALPALVELTEDARNVFLGLLDRLIQADGRTSLFEFVLRRLVRTQLAPARRFGAERIRPARLKDDVTLLLTLLARAGASDPAAARAAFDYAAAQAPLEGPWSMPAADERIGIAALDEAIEHLSACKPGFRKMLIEACAAAVMHDHHVTVREAELLRAVAQALDCPVPPLLHYSS